MKVLDGGRSPFWKSKIVQWTIGNRN